MLELFAAQQKLRAIVVIDITTPESTAYISRVPMPVDNDVIGLKKPDQKLMCDRHGTVLSMHSLPEKQADENLMIVLVIKTTVPVIGGKRVDV